MDFNEIYIQATKYSIDLKSQVQLYAYIGPKDPNKQFLFEGEETSRSTTGIILKNKEHINVGDFVHIVAIY